MDLRSQLFAHNPKRRLFGRYVQQSHAAILVYEQLLDEHREEVHWLCEIGTGMGTLSLYFALWARLRGVPFLTVDNGSSADKWNPSPAVLATLDRLGARVERVDCFSSAGQELICSQIRDGRGLLFCDGGNKPRELRTFGPAACPGSLIVVHDFVEGDVVVVKGPPEVDHAAVEATPEVEYYEPWHTQSIQLATKAAILRRL